MVQNPGRHGNSLGIAVPGPHIVPDHPICPALRTDAGRPQAGCGTQGLNHHAGAWALRARDQQAVHLHRVTTIVAVPHNHLLRRQGRRQCAFHRAAGDDGRLGQWRCRPGHAGAIINHQRAGRLHGIGHVEQTVAIDLVHPRRAQICRGIQQQPCNRRRIQFGPLTDQKRRRPGHMGRGHRGAAVSGNIVASRSPQFRRFDVHTRGGKARLLRDAATIGKISDGVRVIHGHDTQYMSGVFGHQDGNPCHDANIGNR